MSSSSCLIFTFLAAPRAVKLTQIGNKFYLALVCFGALFLSLFHMIQHSYYDNSNFLYICHSLNDEPGQNAWLVMRNSHTKEIVALAQLYNGIHHC